MKRKLLSAVLVLSLIASAGRSASAADPASPQRSIIDLQPARQSESVELTSTPDSRLTLELLQLNPAINAWLLLTLRPAPPSAPNIYHLENAAPQRQRVALDPTRPGQITITASGATALEGKALVSHCQLWPGDSLAQAQRSKRVYAPLCDGRLYLRNPVRGNRSTLEASTEFLRDHVWRGEEIVGFVRREFYQDAFAERADTASPTTASTTASAASASRLADAPGAPPSARMASNSPLMLAVAGLGISVGTQPPLLAGHWYPATGAAGVFASVAQPAALQSDGGRSSALDPVEAKALTYLVAFDLTQLELGFALGTEHPRLGWSARARSEIAAIRPDGTGGPSGPDGIANALPLVRTGLLSPALQSRVLATFTGGFKREHGAFRYGSLAAVNQASHYGFIEQGVVFSRLVPGLATLYILNDGQVGMKTWQPQDDARWLAQIRHARQNGVALVEPAADGGPPRFGALVERWGAGNWSGSADEHQRTLRAGACWLEQAGRQFLIYGYFSTATPLAMAHVFQAYGCQYAMHLDMNALEHTYLALYPRLDSRRAVKHLVPGMSVLDKGSGDALLPRFIGFADDRDFFYLLRREAGR